MYCKSFVAAVLLLLAVSSGCEQTRSSDQFHRGRDLLIKGQFDAAESELAAFEKHHPRHELLSRAKFLRAKSSLGTGNLQRARQLFQETIKQFPNSEEAAKARYKLALIDLLESDLEAARRSFQSIVDRSDSILVAEATAMLEMLSPPKNE